jgi:phage gpG-like protein
VYNNAWAKFVSWKKTIKKTCKKTNDAGRALLVLTSRLRRSLHASPLHYEARVVTDVPYAETHQKGFKGVITQRISAFTRRKMGKFGVIKTTSLKKSTRIAFGRGQVGQSQVKSHTRTIRVNIPARPFMEVGKSFYDKTERTILTEIEQLFLKS